MSEVNKIANYNQMMSWLTRPSTPQTETRENFAEGSSAAAKEILSNLPKGSEINRTELIKKTDIDPSRLTKLLKKFEKKNFIIKKQPNISKGKRRTLIATPEFDKIAKAAYGKKFDELNDTLKTNINTGKITEESMTSFRRQKILESNLKNLNKVSQDYYNKDYLNLDEGRKQRVREERGFIDTAKIAREKIKKFTKNYKDKYNNKLPTKKEVIDGANVSWGSVTKAADEGIIKLDPSGQVESRMKPLNEDLLKLSKNKEVKEALFKGETNKLLKLTKNILKLDDSSVIEARIGQLASAYTGDRNVPGINTDKKIEKIIPNLFKGLENSRRERRKLADLQVGKSVGERTLASARQTATKSYPSIPYDIDEPLGVTSSVRRGTTPYGIFAQIIDRKSNQTVKKSYDSIKSKQEKILQDALATGDKKLIDNSVKEFNDTASKYEKLLNKDKKPGSKKIKLLKVSLDEPKNTISNYKNFSKNYKKAFEDNYSKRGYSFKVPKDIKDAFTIAKELKNPKNVDKVVSGAEAGFGRLYSNPMADPTLLKQGLKDIGKFGKYAGQIALTTPAGVALSTKALDGTIDPRTTEGRLTAGAEAAFAPGLVKGTEAFTKNKILQRILNLGLSPKMAMRAARVASPLGIATLLGEAAYQGGKFSKKRIAELKEMSPEEREELEKIRDEFSFGEYSGAKDGGIMRQGFADGPDDPSKRKFMKIAGGLASIPILGKFIKPAVVAAPKVAEIVKRSADGIPEFLGDLVTKVVTFGKKNFTGNRADEFADQYRLDDYVVTQQGNKTTIKKVDDKGEFGYKEHEMELETDPETGGVTYNEASVRPDAEGKLKDVEEYIDDLDLEDMKKYTYDE